MGCVLHRRGIRQEDEKPAKKTFTGLIHLGKGLIKVSCSLEWDLQQQLLLQLSTSFEYLKGYYSLSTEKREVDDETNGMGLYLFNALLLYVSYFTEKPKPDRDRSYRIGKINPAKLDYSHGRGYTLYLAGNLYAHRQASHVSGAAGRLCHL